MRAVLYALANDSGLFVILVRGVIMLDALIIEFDKALRTLSVPATTSRSVPGGEFVDSILSDQERRHAGALMRINHVGEVCAQALYQGQSLTSSDPGIRHALEKAAGEETEHLAWTERRIHELGARKSILNPLWYAGSLTIGLFAGKLGDGWSLGFLAETERQVEAHLDHHLSELPVADAKSRAIVQQMKTDEISHAETAVRLGARTLPLPFRITMKITAKIMTRTAYFV